MARFAQYNIRFKQRPFIYRNREDIDEFLNESLLWDDIYDVFLRVKDNSYRLKVSYVKMFNEVRYQCVRLMLDKHPEENIYINYLNDARDTLGTRYASDLCFSMVYAVLSLLKNPPQQVIRFCTLLRDKELNNDTCYFPYFRQFVDDHVKHFLEYEIDLKPMPENPAALTDDSKWWKDATNDFDQDSIREVLSLWTGKQERLDVLQIIEHAFNLDEQASAEVEHMFDLPF